QALGAAATIVRDDAHRCETQDVALLRETTAPVDLLAKEEEALVEQSNVVDRGTPDKHIAPRNNVDNPFTIPFPVLHTILIKKLWPTKPFQRRHLQEFVNEGRILATGILKGAVAVEDTAAENGDLAMRLHVFERLRQDVAMHEGVGIQEQHILPLGNPHG